MFASLAQTLFASLEKSNSTTFSGIKRKLTDQLNQCFKLALVLAAAPDSCFCKLFLSKSEQDKLQRVLLQKASNTDCTVATDVGVSHQPKKTKYIRSIAWER